MTVTIASSCGSVQEHVVGKNWSLRDLEDQLLRAHSEGHLNVDTREIGSSDHIIIHRGMSRDLTLKQLCVYPGDTIHFMDQLPGRPNHS